MDDEQRSRLLALGSLNLTAETSRWMHAARTWTEAWYGVLHDSEQDFGDARRRQKGLVVERLGCETTLAEQLKERIANGIPSIGEQCSAMGYVLAHTMKKVKVRNGMQAHQDQTASTDPRTKQPCTYLAPEHAIDTTALSTTCSHPHRATARSTSGPRTESITSSAPRQ
ncbi:hypothetical protein HBI56_178520 [Parastagonospora nodorum]|uniref:Uncharacterized protein n=1 Tax=Phaeosphaeria nodorum (strain SN15 / ATCC MYA-4574 / FGSC 10173) TaxID=321614 RepID=A0A7U2ETS6_PHANO|nr:hypothetical protein HBH56_046780 [Parastagonospora nodorum]QRC92587.1 hypothetical protein JI435_083600 [Parastagonospora nodorum SN15]KAH3933241.1 hypothetical protein HBH54_074530 [Parastagonospora nodorum]KAH3973237.1 hypothetical protein HBH52_146580 [Parastagonospora nodorum]KAH3980678.1 hypothetical protein HBH51_052510 [Parastagonospora nodorum]